jgi:hypothetical protein
VTGPVCVLAWSVAEGDVLPGGETVLSVLRDPAADRVTIATTDGERRELRRQDRLVISRRAVPDVLTRPGWRVGAFVATARRTRRALVARRRGLPVTPHQVDHDGAGR